MIPDNAAWAALTPYEQLVLVFEVATIYLARTVGLPRETIDGLGEPSVESLDVDPVVFAWPDGTRVEIPQDALVAAVALRLEQRARRRANLN